MEIIIWQKKSYPQVYLPTRRTYRSSYAQIGAAIVVHNKGPAFVPTPVESFNDFKEKFGGLNLTLFNLYSTTIYEELRRVTVVRVLHLGGYSVTTHCSFMVQSFKKAFRYLDEKLMAVLAPRFRTNRDFIFISSLS